MASDLWASSGWWWGGWGGQAIIRLQVGRKPHVPASNIVHIFIYIAFCVSASYIDGNILYVAFCHRYKYDCIH